MDRRAATDSKQRFSDRVELYLKYRPRYPRALLDLLRDRLGLAPTQAIADIGSGTGFLSELLLQNGNRVYGVEPNTEMRRAAEERLQGYARFTSVAGSAETTGLAGRSMDLITVGQAFHWFDPIATRREFSRILRPGSHVVLVWNERKADSPLGRAYEALLVEYGIDYTNVTHRNVDDDRISAFYGEAHWHKATLANLQHFDLAALKGRLLSSSYTPREDHPRFAAMLDRLAAIFAEHQVDGQVAFEYDTKVYWGELA